MEGGGTGLIFLLVVKGHWIVIKTSDTPAPFEWEKKLLHIYNHNSVDATQKPKSKSSEE